MAGVNKVFLLGNLGADPEVKRFDDGSIVNLRLATKEVYKDRNGERQERTEWHRLVVRGRLAGVAEQYLEKGKQVFVEGKITTRKFQDQDGNDRFITEVMVLNFQMLGSPKGGDQQGSAPSDDSSSGGQETAESPQSEDDLPF